MLTLYEMSQMSITSKVAPGPMSLWLDSRPLKLKGHDGSGETLPQGNLMSTLGGNLREKKKKKKKKKKKRKKKKMMMRRRRRGKRKKRKKRKGRQSRT